MDSANKNIEIQTAPSPATAPYLLALGFALICVVPFAVAWDLTRALFTLVWTNDTFSQIPLIPVVSLFLIYGSRKEIFTDISFGWATGAALIVPGLAFVVAARLDAGQISAANQATVLMFGIVLIWMGAFALFFGTHAFRAARIPLIFLIFAIPIPEPFLSKLIAFLQEKSADTAQAFFSLGRVPYLRRGLIFDLPGVSIQVAEECSGIRSTLALFITTALAAALFLKSNWRRLLLLVVVVPIAILKNGLRIATLSTLAIYVNPAFLTGNLHHHGGVLFFLIALIPMALLLIFLERQERARPAAAARA